MVLPPQPQPVVEPDVNNTYPAYSENPITYHQSQPESQIYGPAAVGVAPPGQQVGGEGGIDGEEMKVENVINYQFDPQIPFNNDMQLYDQTMASLKALHLRHNYSEINFEEATQLQKLDYFVHVDVIPDVSHIIMAWKPKWGPAWVSFEVFLCVFLSFFVISVCAVLQFAFFFCYFFLKKEKQKNRSNKKRTHKQM